MSLGRISLVKIKKASKKKISLQQRMTCLCVLTVDNCFAHTCIVPLSGVGRSMLFYSQTGVWKWGKSMHSYKIQIGRSWTEFSCLNKIVLELSQSKHVACFDCWLIFPLWLQWSEAAAATTGDFTQSLETMKTCLKLSVENKFTPLLLQLQLQSCGVCGTWCSDNQFQSGIERPQRSYIYFGPILGSLY